VRAQKKVEKRKSKLGENFNDLLGKEVACYVSPELLRTKEVFLFQ